MRFFTTELEKFGLKVASLGSAAQFLTVPPGGVLEGKSSGALLSDLELELEQYESQLLDLNKFSDKLTNEYNEKIELHEVLLKSKDFFNASASAALEMHGAGGARAGGSPARPLLEEDFGLVQESRMHSQAPARGGGGGDSMRFESMTGILLESERARFERALFRATRGNCYVRFADVDALMDDGKGGRVAKVVFIVFYKSAAIEAKARRIADAFGARRYSVPDAGDAGAIAAALERNHSDLTDARKVLIKNREMRHALCRDLAGLAQGWLWTVLREKACFATLNCLKPDVSGMLRGEGWVTSTELDSVRAAVEAAHGRVALGGACVVSRMAKPWPEPPTSFQLNAFTTPYQEFVDTYGIPRYKEANPALFTAVTFPFLFGIMYGDIGHGTVLALGGLYLCLSYSDDPKRGEMMAGMYMARYMLLMMGLFAVYAGMLYNDIFSLPLSLFTSQYKWEEDEPEKDTPAVMKCAYGDASCVYPFGVDPAWHISNNELLFFNSMKMKISVVLGIIQMCVGVALKGFNASYYNDKVGLWLEVAPMVVFAFGMFGYMIVLIFIKWTINWEARMWQGTCRPGKEPAYPDCLDNPEDYTLADICKLGEHGLDLGGVSGGCQPPNLITTLINIALAPGSVDEPMYAGQATVQSYILIAAFLSVPVLLFGKPCFVKYGGGGGKPAGGGHGGEEHEALGDGDGHGGGGGGGGHDDHGDFTEVVIHQAIETIEFVLGMVSNTASYLRLWALSLAHTELAAVFWEKAMLASIEMKNPVAIFAGYAVFAAVTFAVLLAMDVLECFLHALRLHWVEFQNKFYKADGYKFKPFAIEPLLRAAS